MATWRVMAKEGERKIGIACPWGRFAFEVYKGTVGRPLWLALKSLQAPVLRNRVPHGFTVTCPDKFNGRSNTGANRRFLLLQPAGKAPVTLRLLGNGARLEKPFVLALRDVLERRVDPGTTLAKLSQGASGPEGWGAVGGRRNKKTSTNEKEQAA